jgi:hypothetical protein
MLSHGMIKVLHVLFVLAMGASVLWLFIHAFAADRRPVKKPSDRPLPLMIILRDGLPFLKMPLANGRYVIGREASCDIALRGPGLPPIAGEIRVIPGRCLFRGGIPPRAETDLSPGRELVLANYVLRIE